MASMVERLQLVVDATTQSAETRFDRLTTAARETGDASVRSAADVATAADRVMAAQGKQADAAGQLRVAQQRLQDLQDKGNASAAQLAAAEERVASAQRKLHNATRETVAATDEQIRVQAEAEVQAEDTGQAQSRLGDKLGDLKGQVAGLVAGGALVGYLKNSMDAFTAGARGANTLSIAMNATVAQGGQLSQLFSSLGLEASDLLEIQAEFAQKIGANGEALAEFGAEVKKNDDGTTNWALTLTDALTQLQKIPDATVRNATGFRLFGEEGYKQLSRLMTSGMSVEDALARIGTPFTEEDVRATQEYDNAMMDLSLTSGDLGRSLAREVLPIVTGLVHGFGAVADVVAGVPLPMGLAALAAVGLGLAQRSAAAEGGLMAGVLTAGSGVVTRFTGAVATAAVGTGVLGTTMGVATLAGRGLLTVLGGPIGIAILALGAAFTFLNSKTDDNDEAAQAATDANQSLAQAIESSHGVITRSVRQQAALSAQHLGLLDSAKKAGVATSDLTSGLTGNAEAYDATRSAMNDYADSLDNEANALQVLGTGSVEDVKKKRQQADAMRAQVAEYEKLHGTVGAQVEQQQQLAGATDETTDKQQLATAAVDALKAAIDGGATSTEQFTGLVAKAAEAQAAAAVANDTAEAAIAAYRASTDGAVQATLDLISAQLGLEDAEYGYLDALDALKDAKDDEKTSVDEVAQAHTRYKGAALDAAQAAADAAVEAAKAAGTVVGPLEEANLRADAMLSNLRTKLNEPGLSDGARADLEGLIGQLQTAKDKGDVQALVTLTGAQEAKKELDGTTEDREAHVNVESRGGPAVMRYLETIANTARLALIRVESRGGPAVEDYLETLRVRDRLAIVRVESRGGPAVDSYVNGLAHERLAIIRVETRGGPDVDRYLDNLASQARTAVIDVRRNGSGAPGSPTGGPAVFGAPVVAGRYGDSGGSLTVQQLTVQVVSDGAGRLTQQSLVEAGRQAVAAIGAYERKTGAGWRRTP